VKGMSIIVEKLINSNINAKIDFIESISGGNQLYEILFRTKENERFKLTFDWVWDLRCAVENAYN
jgi:hypothetical protein